MNNSFTTVGHTKTHPHGYMWCSRRFETAFVRISKCGSSTFVSAIQANEVLPFTEIGQFRHVMCAIRNPQNRFLSSIPETIKRIYHVYEREDDVLVKEEIIDFLRGSELSSVDRVLEAFVAAIERFGFFDAHHEPMVRFLVDDAGDLACNPQLFLLESMDHVLQELVGVVPKRKNSRQLLKKDFSLGSILRIAGLLNGKDERERKTRSDSLLHAFENHFTGEMVGFSWTRLRAS